MEQLLAVPAPGLVEADLDAVEVAAPIEVAAHEPFLPRPAIVGAQRRRQRVGEVPRPVALRRALPVAQPHRTVGRAVPVADVHVRVEQRRRLGLMDAQRGERGRPHLLASPEQTVRDVLGRLGDGLLVVHVHAELVDAAEEPPRVPRQPAELLAQPRIVEEATVVARHQVDHRLGHVEGHQRRRVAERRTAGGAHVLEDVHGGERLAVDRRVVAERDLEVEVRAQLGVEAPFGPSVSGDAGDHAGLDGRERLREQGRRWWSVTDRIGPVGDVQSVTDVGARAHGLDAHVGDDGARRGRLEHLGEPLRCDRLDARQDVADVDRSAVLEAFPRDLVGDPRRHRVVRVHLPRPPVVARSQLRQAELARAAGGMTQKPDPSPMVRPSAITGSSGDIVVAATRGPDAVVAAPAGGHADQARSVSCRTWSPLWVVVVQIWQASSRIWGVERFHWTAPAPM
jgi:hypothetical protein